MRKKFFFLAALLTAMVMNLWALDPVSYLYPVYNTAGDPTSGIKEWKTGSCTEYTVVENATKSVTWSAGWYVVNEAVVSLTKYAKCSGAVHLILVDGAKLTVGKTVVVSGDANSIVIYGQAGNTGQLIATGSMSEAGIGGDNQDSGSNITVNGGTVTATGGSNAAGIGGGSGGSGSNITINGGTVTASGKISGSGIGGAGTGSGSNITVNGGTVTATGGNSGTGIGGGNGGSGSNITINGGTVTAIGKGTAAAGIGGGGAGCGSNIRINGGTVTATGSSAGIGKGLSCTTAASNIFVNPASILKADGNNPPTTEIAHATITTDIAASLAGKKYVTIVTPEPEDITFSETGDKADITAYLSKLVNATISRTFYKDGERNSICLPFALSTLEGTPLEGGTLEEFSSAEIVNKGKDNETLELTMTDATEIVAGKPYIITWTNDDDLVNPKFENVTVTREVGDTVTSGKVQFIGTFVPKAVEKDDKGILFVGTGAELKWPNVTGNINGFRSYFQLDLSASSPLRQGMKAMLAGGKTTPTDIDETEANAKIQKLIQEGRVMIISNGVRYDLNGNIVK